MWTGSAEASTSSAQALVDFVERDPSLQPWVFEIIEELVETSSPAI
ncbi:MAG: hypothetical protein KKD28_03995 [Chloroflexi bacterium]|nr:hypothetical protein [Chloroflexota bacterium]MBU1660615.1 hypothetical protein [Chloroflexota bacterium]